MEWFNLQQNCTILQLKRGIVTSTLMRHRSFYHSNFSHQVSSVISYSHKYIYIYNKKMCYF